MARNLRLDNIKGVLIALVVIGHAIEPLIWRSGIAATTYWFIYLFHMPAFVAVSGYMSRLDPDPRKMITDLIIPYLVLELAYTALQFHLSGTWQLSVFTPYWILWYLFALIVWRIMLPYWMMLKWPLAAAVAVGLLVGITNHIGYYFSLSRIFVFLPFFVAGAALAQAQLSFTIRLQHKVWAVAVLAGAALAAIYLRQHLQVQWLYGSYSYEALERNWQEGIAIRLGLYAAATAAGLALLALVPSRETVWGWLGKHSFYPFVVHGAVVKLAGVLYGYWTGEWQTALLILVSVATTFVLASAPVRRAVSFIVTLGGLSKLLLADGKGPKSRPALHHHAGY